MEEFCVIYKHNLILGAPYPGQPGYNQYGGPPEQYGGPPGQYSPAQNQFPPANRSMYPPYGPPESGET